MVSGHGSTLCSFPWKGPSSCQDLTSQPLGQDILSFKWPLDGHRWHLSIWFSFFHSQYRQFPLWLVQQVLIVFYEKKSHFIMKNKTVISIQKNTRFSKLKNSSLLPNFSEHWPCEFTMQTTQSKIQDNEFSPPLPPYYSLWDAVLKIVSIKSHSEPRIIWTTYVVFMHEFSGPLSWFCNLTFIFLLSTFSWQVLVCFPWGVLDWRGGEGGHTYSNLGKVLGQKSEMMWCL